MSEHTCTLAGQTIGDCGECQRLFAANGHWLQKSRFVGDRLVFTPEAEAQRAAVHGGVEVSPTSLVRPLSEIESALAQLRTSDVAKFDAEMTRATLALAELASRVSVIHARNCEIEVELQRLAIGLVETFEDECSPEDGGDGDLPILKAVDVAFRLLDELRASREQTEAHLTRELVTRDLYHDAADELAYAIAPVEDIGEHTNLNNPWKNAIAYLEGERAARKERELAPHELEIAAGVCRFLRGAFYNDGAEGESVHKACELIEKLTGIPRSPSRPESIT